MFAKATTRFGPRRAGRARKGTAAVAAVLLAAALTAACGSKETPFSPTGNSGNTGPSAQLLAPTVFIVTAQQIKTDSNQLAFSWVSSETSFQLVIGSSSGASDVLSQVVTGNTFTWTSPRPAKTYYARIAAKRADATSAFSDELTLTVVDIRNMVEAMFFHTGPMSDANESGASNVALMWPDGMHLTVLVSPDAIQPAGTNAQTFADQYATLTANAITATVSSTTDRMQGTQPQNLPDFTIGIRVQAGFCSSGALACANYGPSPGGPDSSIVTLATAGPLQISATAHEMGHAYGMGHIQTPASGRPEFRFMMNSNSGAEQMTDAEKLTVTFARTGDGRGRLLPGMSRSEAISRGLINQ
jgi:hypothetical protein